MSKALFDDFDSESYLGGKPQSFQVDQDWDPGIIGIGTRIEPELSTIGEVFAVSKVVKPRTRYEILASLVEEVGELSTEVAIAEGYSKKEKGKDQVIGEAVDVIVCALDMIFVDWKGANPKDLENFIHLIVKTKVAKWKTKQEL